MAFIYLIQCQTQKTFVCRKGLKIREGQNKLINYTFCPCLNYLRFLIAPFNLWCFNLNHHLHIFLKLAVLVTSQLYFYLFICVFVLHRWAVGQQCRNQYSREVWGTCHKYYATSLWVSQTCSDSSPNFLRMLIISSITTIRYRVNFCVCLTKILHWMMCYG